MAPLSLDPAWHSALALLAVALIVPAGALMAARLLGVKARQDLPTKFDTYECGEEPDGAAWLRFHPRYYVVALLFVLFDVEAVFMLPWALNLEALGALAWVEMLVFVAILMLGWGYAVRKGAIRWQ